MPFITLKLSNRVIIAIVIIIKITMNCLIIIVEEVAAILQKITLHYYNKKINNFHNILFYRMTLNYRLVQ